MKVRLLIPGLALIAAAGVSSRTETAAAPPVATVFTAGCVESVLVFGPTDYTKSSGTWTIHEGDFTPDSVPGWRYVVEITNGSPSLTSCLYSINSQQYVGLSEFGSSTTKIRRTIDVVAGEPNYFDVQLAGTSGRKVTVRVWRFRDPSFLVHGPEQYVRPATISHQLDTFVIASAAKTPYTLRAINGDPGGSNRLTTGTLHINGNQVLSSADLGTGVATITKTVSLAETNILDLYNQSASGTRVTLSLSATDSTPPVLTVSQPGDTFLTKGTGVRVSGAMSDETPGWVGIVGRAPFATPTASFTDSVPLVYGTRALVIQATNSACLTSTDTVVAIKDTLPPVLTMFRPFGADTAVTESLFTVQGYRSDLTRTIVAVDGDTVIEGASGAFSHSYPLDWGPNRILIRVTDQLGYETETYRFVYRKNANDDPWNPDVPTLAGTLSGTGSTDFLDQVHFLIEGGGSAIQKDADSDSILAELAAVIRGRVIARDGDALHNVEVRVLGHPGYGYTTTRGDGAFDLLVNGGAQLTLRFTKPNFLEAQRRVAPAVNDYTMLDTVGMIGRTSNRTVVDFNSPVVARGRFASDLNGQRDPRLLFADSTVVTVTKSDGNQVSFSAARIRATEYTVGGDGPNAMPAILPPTSAYTYCVDFQLDEAESLRVPGQPAPSAAFSKPVPVYLKNFLHLPAGTRIPAGYYDQNRGAWSAADDGIVMAIVGVSGDTARIDADGNGSADTDAQLEALGVNAKERIRLATQFVPGDTVWRVAVDHFTIWDFNLNWATIISALSTAATRALQAMGLLDNPCLSSGSVIECENRVLGQEVAIVGTPHTLNYRSYRTPGDLAIRTLRIPVIGDSIPPGCIKVTVRMEVAGRRYQHELTPAEGLVDTFTWDGLDVYGRRVNGAVNATVHVGFRFLSVWGVGTGSQRAFNDPMRFATPVDNANGDRGGGRVVWTRQVVSLGAPSTGSDGLGGWTVSPHHYFDRTGRGTVYYGDGRIGSGARVAIVTSYWACPSNCTIGSHDVEVGPDGVAYVAGGSSIFKIGLDGQRVHLAGDCAFPNQCNSQNYNGDGPALTRDFKSLARLARGPDGSIYFVSSSEGAPNIRVYRLKGDSVVTVAGDGTQGTNGYGDGYPAKTHARFDKLTAIAFGPDGSMYLGDTDDHRIRRIDPSGIITTYAGTGGTFNSGPVEGKASEVGFSYITDLVVDDAGNLYTAESANRCVRRIEPNGRVSLVHSSAQNDFWPIGLALGADGSIFISSGAGEEMPNRVYRRDPDGTMAIIAGQNVGSDGQSDGRIASGAFLWNPNGLSIAPDGAIFLAESNEILRIGPTLPSRVLSEVMLPSDEGSEAYYFDATTGRHLYTRDALTGAVRFRFDYSSGRLTAIHDVSGRTTTIQRSGGLPTSITAPDGQVTSLALDANGWLDEIRNPLGDTIRVESRADGLMTDFYDANGQRGQYDWADDGRLEVAEDARAEVQTLEADFDGRVRTVEHESPENLITTYVVNDRSDGTRVHSVTVPGSLRSVWTDSTDNVTRLLRADGSTQLTRPLPDPRFGMLAPLVAQQRDSLPVSHLARVVNRTVSYSTSQFQPPTTIGTWIEELKVNGRSDGFRTEYVPGTRKLTTETPEGREVVTDVDSAGRPLSVAVPNLATLSIQYDMRGRDSVVSQSVRGWRYSYDSYGRLMTLRDTLDRVSSFEYDDNDRLTRQWFPDGRDVDFGYDAGGNLTNITPPGRPAHAFAYDEVDLNTRYTAPAVDGVASPALRFAYDGDRKLTKIARAGVDSILFDYDGAGRLEGLDYGRGAHGFTYAASGHVATATSPDTVTLTYGYDGPLVTSQTWTGKTPGGATLSVAHDYNADFLVWKERVNGGSEVTFGYDDDGLMTSAGGLTIHRRADNGLVDSTQAGSLTHSQDYNAFGELANLRYAYGGTAIFQQSLARDELGRIVEIAETAFGTSRTLGYRYDQAGRLYAVTVDGDTAARYFYHPNGNRAGWDNGELSPADTASGTSDEQDRLLRWRDTAYEYDDAGDLVQRTAPGPATTSYAYDALGNLNGVDLPGGDSVSYAVDGMNRRIGRKVNGRWSGGWVYRSALNVAAEVDSVGAVVNRYVYGPDPQTPALMLRGGATYRVIADHLGSVRGIVHTGTGAVIQRRDYGAWGEMELETGAGVQALGFAGGLRDSATGLTRFGARDYDAETGRWTVKDPKGFAAGEHGQLLGANLYAYALLDPANLVDVAGTSAAAVAKELARQLPQLDGPYPYGDIAAAIVLSTLAIYEAHEVCAFAREKGENEYTRYAKLEAQRTGQDACAILKAMRLVERDPAKLKKIKQAEKFLGCRRIGGG